VCAGVLVAATGTASAPTPRPWTPPGPDSIQAFASEAKVRFRQVQGDSITETTIAPFERVGQAARRLLRRLGRDQALLAPRIEDTLDSLGLDTDVVHDPTLPGIVLVMVRNPERPSMQAVGYLLWHRGPDLRMQGMAFPPCTQPRLRAWWSGSPKAPYSAAIVYRERGGSGRLGFKFLRLSPEGFYWELVQYEGNGPELGVAGDVAFADLNRDGRPELVAYSPAPPDSVLSVESPVQPVVREAIFTERSQGFVVHDARVVPGPLESLRQFVLALRAGDRERARRLLVDPALLEQARAAGWATGRSPRNFVVDRQEEGQPWPEWLGARVQGATGTKRWVFRFTLRDGRWMIRDWIAEDAPRPDPAAGAPAKTGGLRP
jgi:hypothetical protein